MRANRSIRSRPGRPPKHLTYSYDMTADAGFAMAGRLIQEAQDKPYEDRLKALQVLMPLCLKRIPDKHISTVTSYNISEETAKAMLAEAQRNLLIYKEIRSGKSSNTLKDTSDNVDPLLGEGGGVVV